MATFFMVELLKIKHDRTELYTRAVQPLLWLLIFGTTFNRLRVIPSGSIPYLDYMAPGIIAQSVMFVSIFYGIQVIWERDAGMLTKLMATPTPRAALVTSKAFAAGVRALVQMLITLAASVLLGVHFMWNPLRLLAAAAVVVLGAAFFSMLSVSIASAVLNRDRLMGIGQLITMPLFFASNALYPISLMPEWVRVIAAVNPMSYEVDALRGLLVGTPSSLGLDVLVLTVAAGAGILVASALLKRLAT
jgi:ABC-2 type transport system permease protein